VTEVLLGCKHLDFSAFSAKNPQLFVAIILALWTEDSSSTPSELAFISAKMILSQRAGKVDYFEHRAEDISRILDLLFATAEGSLRRRMLSGFSLWVNNLLCYNFY